MKRLILEMGSGADLYGMDYTKAAIRALNDAIRHSSIILFRSLDLDHSVMNVKVTIGVQDPEQVDVVTSASMANQGSFLLIDSGGSGTRVSLFTADGW